MWRSLRHPNVVPFLGVFNGIDLCLVSKWMLHGTVTTFLISHPTADRIALVGFTPDRNDILGLIWFVISYGTSSTVSSTCTLLMLSTAI